MDRTNISLVDAAQERITQTKVLYYLSKVPVLRRSKSIFLFVFFLLAAFSTSLTAQYRFDEWTTESGLPQNSVNSIVQTPDGYMWFATFGGLVRFDGIKFKIYNTINAPVLKTNRITSLIAGNDGTLFLSAQNGSLISYKDDIFTTVIEKPVAQRSPLGPVCPAKNGEIWLLGQTGLERYVPDLSGKLTMEHVEFPSESEPRVFAIVEDDAGDIWVATARGLYRFQNGAVQSFLYQGTFPLRNAEKGQIAPQRVGILIDCQKRIWLYSNSFLARFENERFIPLIQKENANFNIAENTDGTYFVYSEGKVYRFADDQLGEVLIDDHDILASARSMISDREGNLWMGLNGQGLRRYKRQTARTFAKPDGLTDGPVHFVLEDRNKNIWAGAEGLYKYSGGKFAQIPESAGMNFDSGFESRDGTLWFRTGGDFFTFKEGKFTDFTKESGMEVESVFEDHAGTFYYVINDGLVTDRKGDREHFVFENGFLRNEVQSIFEDRDGGIWFAMTGGATCFRDGVFTTYSTQNGLSNDNVRDIYQDRDGAMWFGTYGGGLNRLKDGKIFPITTREGMNEDIVSRIIVDEKDNFWMLGNRGVSVISRSALNDLAEGKIKTIACESYGVSDGMLNSEGNGGSHPAGWLASDGRLWFASIKGVIVIESAITGLPPPPVYIEDVFLSGKQLESTGEIDVPPETENLEIHYTGLNFTKPEQVKFKYKLEGFDNDWIEVGTRRAAYYTRIPPGSYRFLVTASTTSGVWNEQPAAKNVIVRSDPVWKKWWFILSASVLMLLALVIFYRLRVRQLEKSRLRQQEFSRALIESQEGERKRIAGELHDGLGQTLLIIKNRAFLGTKANDLKTANEQLSEISASSGAAIDQAREIAYYLRPSQLERFGLTSAIEEMVRQAAESSEIEFESRIDSLDGVFSPENEINFYRIVQESVNNVMKHSSATSAKVVIARTAEKIELLIEDNGKGMPEETSGDHKRPGFGLFGIEERIRILGGKFSIRSETGTGTKVLVTIENRNNYEQ